MKQKWLAYITLGSTLLMFVAPFIMMVISDQHFEAAAEDLPIVPAGYSFVIWYFIYLGMLLLGIYQARRIRWEDPRFVKARGYIIINALGNIAWMLTVGWHNRVIEAISSLIVLVTLVQISRVFQLGRPSRDWKEKYIVKLPLALYLGWVTILIPVAFTLFMSAYFNWVTPDLINADLWTILILFGSFLLVVYLFMRQQVDLVYILAVIWGLAATFIGNVNSSQNVAFTALGLAIGLLVTYFVVDRQQMELQKIQMELTALRNQVNPHFLFNSLNTLSNLIPLESEPAHNYLGKLAHFYRYIVSKREDHLVALTEELDGVNHYVSILKERFGDQLSVEVACESALQKNLLPLSLQLLVENAVKHNTITEDHPLRIKIYVDEDLDHLQVENNINERIHVLDSTGVGLSNIRQRYRYYTKRHVEVLQTHQLFRVSLPLIAQDYDHRYH